MKLIPETIKDFGYLKIFDLYSDTELKSIWKEIFYLDWVMDKMDGQSKIDMEDLRAPTDSGGSKMSGEGLFLDNIYRNREHSAILSSNRKLFTDEDINKSIRDTHPSNDNQYKCINRDLTLLNRYSNTQEYAPHTDSATFTAITILLHKPKQVAGGDFNFPDYDISFGCKNNSCLIFPSWVSHSVSKLRCFGEARRYSIAQLMFVGADIT